MEFCEMMNFITNEKYKAIEPDEPRPKTLSNGFITDREKSVAWNEEQVELSIKSRKAWAVKNREIEATASNLFRNDIESAIMDDVGCNNDQAQIISEAASERSTSRYSRIEYSESYADLFRRFLEAGKA